MKNLNSDTMVHDFFVSKYQIFLIRRNSSRIALFGFFIDIFQAESILT